MKLKYKGSNKGNFVYSGGEFSVKPGDVHDVESKYVDELLQSMLWEKIEVKKVEKKKEKKVILNENHLENNRDSKE
jgi:hypothetical protein